MRRETIARLTAVLLLLPVAAAAQITDLRLPISLDADSTAYDGKNSMLMFRGLRMTQGTIGIEAEEGRASNLNFEDSVWQFSGNVVIDVENGHIESDTADLKFTNHQLRLATIAGSPATFELKRPGSEETTYAEAGKLRYDLLAGTIEFSGNAVITEGGNQIASDYLIYNIVEQRINARGSPGDDGKVRITYTPKDGTARQQDSGSPGATAGPAPEPEAEPEPEAKPQPEPEDGAR
ncbi:MAG TPA: lipopolysaccharide transport periplasmic protein LptA [Woeseiaceae bacterium]|nr:lipopolysaccharide transport periplasmic protein LptA [Woeseiaceae bacterium]